MAHIATKTPKTPPPHVAAVDFAELYRQHYGYVYRVVGRLAGTREPDDLVQEVFLVVHRRLPEFEGRAAITTWLFRIAYRVVGAHIRRERRRRQIRRWFGQPEPEVPAEGPATVERAEVRAHLHQSMNQLSWKLRSVLILHDLEEWTAPRIAEQLAVPVDTVYSRLRAARGQMARRWTRFAAAGGTQ